MSAAHSSGSSNVRRGASATDRSPREWYESVLRVVEYNTGGPQPAGMKPHGFVRLHTGSTTDDAQYRAVDAAITKAVRDRELIVWLDRDDRKRYARTTDDGLRDVIEEEAERPDTFVPLVHLAARLLRGDLS